MQIKIIIVLSIFALGLSVLPGCDEIDEAFDSNNDIIVGNFSELDLWIKVDGISTGRVENDGDSKTVADGIQDGVHVVEAYTSDDYDILYCSVVTYFLNDGEDFYWFLQENAEYTGSKEGDC